MKILSITLLHKLLIASYFAWHIFSSTDAPVSLDAFLAGLYQFDTVSYLDIASRGYHADANIQVYPLYPLLISWLNLVFGNWMLSALAVSNLFSILAYMGFYYLAKLWLTPRQSFIAFLYFLFFPTAYFLNFVAYTEPLFACLSLWSLYFYQKQKFKLSSILVFLACLTRIYGIALLLTYLIIFLISFYKKRKIQLQDFQALIPIALGGCAYIIYLFINQHYFGSFTYFLNHQHKVWGIKAAWPFAGLIECYKISFWKKAAFIFPGTAIMWTTSNTIAAFLPFLAIFWAWRRKFYLLMNYSFFYWLILATPSLYLGQPRYVLLCYPVFFALSSLYKRHNYILPIYILGSAWFMYGLTGNFVAGKWAF